MKRQTFSLILIKRAFILILFLCCILYSCQSGCRKAKDKKEEYLLRQSRPMMGTVVEITLQNPDQELKHRAMRMAFEELSRIESLMSRFKPDSELSRLNRLAARRPMQVSQEMIELLQISHKAWQLTSGGFNPTASPLLKLWGFYRQKGRIPAAEEIEERLKLISFQNVIFDVDKMHVQFFKQGVELDFNAIAKGYAIDKAVQKLKAIGISRALVNAGGDIYALGGKESQGHWNIGIRDPQKTDQILAPIQLRDRAIVTSGNYENFFIINGRRYCHIINPQTGYPVEGMLSVTILAEQTALADALATGIFVLGKEKGLNLLNSLEDVEGIIITEEKEHPSGMKIYLSKNLKSKLKFLNKYE